MHNRLHIQLYSENSEDGFVTAYDARVPSLPRPRGVGRLSLGSEATGVQIHPVMENIFVTSDGRGQCRLWDTRTAFSSDQKHSKRSLLEVSCVFPINCLSRSLGHLKTDTY